MSDRAKKMLKRESDRYQVMYEQARDELLKLQEENKRQAAEIERLRGGLKHARSFVGMYTGSLAYSTMDCITAALSTLPGKQE